MIASKIKEEFCYVAYDYEEEIKKSRVYNENN